MIEKDTFFDVKNEIGINRGKLPIVDMPFSFNPSVEGGPSQQYGTLCKFFERCLSLERDSNALVKVEALLYLPDKTVKDSSMNSLKKKKNDKDIRMNV